MARQVAPTLARTGDFIDSFPFAQKAEMLRTVTSLEKVMAQTVRRRGVRNREVVYTFIVAWGYPEYYGTWQIYLLP